MNDAVHSESGQSCIWSGVDACATAADHKCTTRLIILPVNHPSTISSRRSESEKARKKRRRQ